MNAQLLVELLLELNVLNVADVDRELKKLAARVEHPGAAKWFLRVARYFVLNPDVLYNTPYQAVGKHGRHLSTNLHRGFVKADELDNYEQYIRKKAKKQKLPHGGPPTADKAPDWVPNAEERGEELYHFNPIQVRRRDLWQRLSNVVDYVNWLPQDDPFLRTLEKLQTTDAHGFREVMTRATDWATDLKANPWKYTPTSTRPVYEWPDGYKMMKLMTREDLSFEGSAMNHCVGGYFNSVESGQTEIYSLRDERNQPHVTVELIVGQGVRQIRGKGNTHAIKPEYKQKVAEFIAYKRWPVTGDIAAIEGVQVVPTGKPVTAPAKTAVKLGYTGTAPSHQQALQGVQQGALIRGRVGQPRPA